MKTWTKKIDERSWEITPFLRFVIRDGKRILQQMLVCPERWHDEKRDILWIDVELSEES